MNKTCVLCRKTFTIAKEKINVFGRSALDIHSMVKYATKVYNIYLFAWTVKTWQSVVQSAIIDSCD